MKDGGRETERAARRLDQWLWFARLAKSRSLAARWCAAGSVAVNGLAAEKASHGVRAGDAVIVPHGAGRKAVRVLELGRRRGPAAEARLLYEVMPEPVAELDPAAGWTPLLVEDADGPDDDPAL